MKFFTYTFGCQMSVADTEEMSRHFLERGHRLTADLEEADAVLVNTCTVRAHAEHRAISQLGRLKPWKAARPGRLLIVAGCAAERLKDSLRQRFPHVDFVSGAQSIEDFPGLLDKALASLSFSETTDTACAPARAPAAASGILAFVTIMRGCNCGCTYCVVPSVRGREVSRDPVTILREVRERAVSGVKEVTLLGQTVNSYRYPAVSDQRSAISKDTDFADLLRMVNEVEGIERIRFMSSHPCHVHERMIQAMAECRKVCEHLHLPAQSGSDRILQAMSRGYTRKAYLDSIGRLRARIRNLAVTTDILVGFPGETEEDFRQTIDLVTEAAVEAAYCFKFSPREGTPAAVMANQVPEPVREERLKRLLQIVVGQSRRANESLVGTVQEILIEEPGFGRTRTNRSVSLDQKAGSPGCLAKVRIVEARGNALIGNENT